MSQGNNYIFKTLVVEEMEKKRNGEDPMLCLRILMDQFAIDI